MFISGLKDFVKRETSQTVPLVETLRSFTVQLECQYIKHHLWGKIISRMGELMCLWSCVVTSWPGFTNKALHKPGASYIVTNLTLSMTSS